MAHALSSTQVSQLEDAYLKLKTSAQRIKAAQKDNMETLVATSEMATAAFGMGVIDGRFGGVELLGMPLSLLSAAGSHLMGFAGVAPSHMHAFGNGFLANYLSTLGAGVGSKMLADANRPK